MSNTRWLQRAGRRAGRDAGRGALVGLVSLGAGIPLFVFSVFSLASIAQGFGLLLAPIALMRVRSLAGLFRRWSWDWSGVQIESPYRPRPGNTQGNPFGWFWYFRWVITDPATWRDLLWMVVNIPVGVVLGVLPAAMLIDGVLALAQSPIHVFFGARGANASTGAALVGALLLYLGLTRSRLPLHWHALFSRSLLAPSARELEQRVGRLTESRAEVVDASAAELRRIERDLHDGAQARLASLGMSIGLAEQLMRTDPDQALALMAEARAHSGQALIELRALVRGIHPPVLAERGLDGAVRALALTIPLPVDVQVDLPGRPSAPVESAVYFVVAELLANVLKHSGAERAWVELRYARGALIAVVGDDGIGGAAYGPGGSWVAAGAGAAVADAVGDGRGAGPEGAILDGAGPAAASAGPAGGGLRGIERRLAAFDGILAVTSPSGGPTLVTMELPCVLSSART
ncbi:MAG TPA: sensor domain-containing protein [Actinocrinis sp.]|nr:sensor domain-containing protein [Actinocrinis sp.]